MKKTIVIFYARKAAAIQNRSGLGNNFYLGCQLFFSELQSAWFFRPKARR